VIGNFNLASLLHFSEARDMIDFVFLEKELNTFAVAVCNGTAAFHHGGEVWLYILHRNAIVCRMLQVFKHISTFEQGFCGNTSPIQAHTAHPSFLDHTYLHSKLRSAYGGNITTWSAPDDNDIVFRHILGI